MTAASRPGRSHPGVPVAPPVAVEPPVVEAVPLPRRHASLDDVRIITPFPRHLWDKFTPLAPSPLLTSRRYWSRGAQRTCSRALGWDPRSPAAPQSLVAAGHTESFHCGRNAACRPTNCLCEPCRASIRAAGGIDAVGVDEGEHAASVLSPRQDTQVSWLRRGTFAQKSDFRPPPPARPLRRRGSPDPGCLLAHAEAHVPVS